ncbi:MAG: helix-turn-helix transcriptional regulator [Planctomycetes bacterium]|nr:helix-turn-helix transcriptional regulator [Planctomycetota bacterium]
MTRPHLDVRALRDALDQQRRTRKLSWRQVASEAGVSPSTLSRMADDKRPDVDSFAALVKWLGVPADAFLVTGKGETIAAQQASAVLSTHLRAGKNLSPEAVDAVQDLLGAIQRLMDSGSVAPPRNEDGS